MRKSKPQRMCIGCRQLKEKDELVRIVKTQDTFCVDTTGKVNGRGAYICKDSVCLKKAMASHALERSFKQVVSKEICEQLEKEMTQIIEQS